MKVLMPTSEWPSAANPNAVPFIVRQVEHLRSAGAEVIVFPFRGGAQPGNYLRAWRAFQKEMRLVQPDLVHAQFGQSGLLALPKRRPLVVTFRGDDLLGIVGDNGRYTRSGRVLQAASRFVARHADRRIIVSEHMRALLPRGLSATVAPSGLDLSLMAPIPRAEARQRLGIEGAGRIVLFAGNPAERRKRFDLAQETMERLPVRLGARLEVAWGMPQERVALWMSAADALLFTSMHEGSPNVVKEALACNLPVVSVAVGDLSNRLRGIRNCCVVEEATSASLAEFLQAILETGERSNGRDHVRDLDEQRVTETVLGVYRNLLEDRESERSSRIAAAGEG